MNKKRRGFIVEKVLNEADTSVWANVFSNIQELKCIIKKEKDIDKKTYKKNEEITGINIGGGLELRAFPPEVTHYFMNYKPPASKGGWRSTEEGYKYWTAKIAFYKFTLVITEAEEFSEKELTA